MSDLPPAQSLEDAIALDAVDPLAHARSAFALPDGVIYLVGHSLGPATHRALETLDDAARTDWSVGMVGSWNTAGWIDLPQTLGATIAQLIGVDDSEVIVCDSVSVNLFKLVGALVQSRPSRVRIIVESGEFPTDQYVLERLAARTGSEFVRAAQGTGMTVLEAGDILVRSLVDYRTAEIADMQRMEALAERKGAAIVWDLSHATGVLDLALADHGAKYAVGCTYKYLNGGPGAPAFIYARRDVSGDLQTPLAGWLGHADPFAFADDYRAAEGVQRFVAGTPPILSMSALKGALDLFEGIDMAAVETKARQLGDMCLAAFDRLDLVTSSPGIGHPRGGHVSLNHGDAYAISQALAAQGIKTDFRTPDTIRFGLSPLCLRHEDVWTALDTLAEIVSTMTYRRPEYAIRSKVT